MTSRRGAMSNQCWNNIVNVNIEIFNVEQRQTNVVYFNFDVNVRQRRNNAVTFNVEFHDIDQRRNNVVSAIIFKKLKEQKIFLSFKKKMNHLINNTCFRLWSIEKKGKHGTYSIKLSVGKYNAWYMKRLWK